LLVADEPSATVLFQRARKAEKKGHIAQAYLLYSEAAAKEPSNRMYWMKARALRTRAALESLVMPVAPVPDADDQTDDTADATPDQEPFVPDPATIEDTLDSRRKLPPTELTPNDGTGDIDLRGDSKQLWEGVAKIYGLDCVFDADYTPMAPMRFQLRSVDYRVAIHGLEAATGTFIIPLSGKIFLVAKDTPQKRTELQPRVAVSIPLPDSVSQQDFNQAVTAVQQAVGIEKISFDSQNKVVILRDTVGKVTVARALFQELLRPPAQVVVDLKLVEVTRNDMLTYGIDFPNTFTLNFLTNWLTNQVIPPASISGLLTFGGGKTLMGLGILTPSLVAQMSKSNATNLLESELRTTDGLPATMHIGEQYPVLTSQYVGPANFSQGGTVYTPPPSFQFVDLGLSLKITPAVRTAVAATLDVDAEFKVLTGQSNNGIPVIANRAVKSQVTLPLGNWAVIGGLLDVEDAYNITGIAGISEIRYLGPLTTVHNKTKSSDIVLLLMRPRLVSLPPSEMSLPRAYRMGSETRPLIPL
jgi:general secretion pathway protein D